MDPLPIPSLMDLQVPSGSSAVTNDPNLTETCLDPVDKSMGAPRDPIRRKSMRERTTYTPWTLPAHDTGVRHQARRAKRRKPNNSITPTAPPREMMFIHIVTESLASADNTRGIQRSRQRGEVEDEEDEKNERPEGEKEAEHPELQGMPPFNRVEQAGFYIDLTMPPSRTHHSSKRNGFSTTATTEQAGSQSAPRRHPSKGPATKRKPQASTTKRNTRQPENTIVEQLACIEIPSYTTPSGPSRVPTHKIRQIKRVADHTDPGASPVKVHAQPDMPLFTDQSVLAVNPIFDRTTHDGQAGACDNNAGNNIVESYIPAPPINLDDDTHHSNKTVIENILGILHSDNANDFIDIKPGAANVPTRDNKPDDQIQLDSVPDLCSHPPTSSPYLPAATEVGGNSPPGSNDQDNSNQDAGLEGNRPAHASTVGSRSARVEDFQQESLFVARPIAITGSQFEDVGMTFVHSDSPYYHLPKETSDSVTRPSSPEQSIVQPSSASTMKANVVDDSGIPTFSCEDSASQFKQQGTFLDQVESRSASDELQTDKHAVNPEPDLSDPLTGPYSKYASADISKVISYETYARFPDKIRRAFADLLPVCIRNNPRYLDVDTGTATEAFFTMQAFNRAKLDWQKALAEGKFTDEYKSKVADLRRHGGHRLMTTAATATGGNGESWKSDDYERFYGEKAIQANVLEMEAGDSSKASLAKICFNKGIQVGDWLLYVREFQLRQHISRQPVRQKSTFSDCPVPAVSIVESQQPTERHQWISRLSKLAMIDNTGTNKDKDEVLISKASRIKVDQLMRVIQITTSGKPTIEFIGDGNSKANDKDEVKSKGLNLAAVVKPSSTRKSPREQEQQQYQRQQQQQRAVTDMTDTYEVDSALAIERICLERDGQVPRAERKNASESWKHVHVFRPAEGLEERALLEERDKDVIYVGSLFAIRMDIYNHLQSEKAKKQVLMEDIRKGFR
ncbi:hypothetical protein BGZ95_011265 [Linnemannia exigua]|uniref:ASX DEUBAD domain-containing protein n=1 Tax=Linnemannia exigua TaxID=604196 RepID=A0AAD4DJY9_9FUNG|nr:hypothetical protein BGZ95_011265 [Linnemannia exigua]